VLTYIRNSWGNHADSMSVPQIKKIRKQLN